MHLTVNIHPEENKAETMNSVIAGDDTASPLSLKSSCVFYLCEKGEAEWLLCLCNLRSGLGYSVNTQQRNAGIVTPSYGLSVRHNNGGSEWVKDWKMFHKNIMKKYWQCEFSQIKADKNMNRTGGRTQRRVLS